jgi:hypothetical protein
MFSQPNCSPASTEQDRLMMVKAYHADEALELLLDKCGELKTGSEGCGRHLLP